MFPLGAVHAQSLKSLSSLTNKEDKRLQLKARIQCTCNGTNAPRYKAILKSFSSKSWALYICCTPALPPCLPAFSQLLLS